MAIATKRAQKPVDQVERGLVLGIVQLALRLVPLRDLRRLAIRRVGNIDQAREFFRAYLEVGGGHPDPDLLLEPGVTAYAFELDGRMVAGFAHCCPPRRSHLFLDDPLGWSWEGWDDALEVVCLFVAPAYRRSWLSSLTWLGALTPCALYPRSVAGTAERKLANLYRQYGGKELSGPNLFVWERDEVIRQLSGSAMRYIFRWRYYIQIPVAVSFGGHTYKTATQDISLGGVFIPIHPTFRVGSSLHLSFTMPSTGETVTSRGNVRWVDANKGIGVQLSDVGSTDAWKLLKVLAGYRPAVGTLSPEPSAQSVKHAAQPRRDDSQPSVGMDVTARKVREGTARVCESSPPPAG